MTSLGRQARRRSSGSRRGRTRSSGRGSGARRSARTLSGCNFLRTLALPGEVAQWSLTSLREKVVRIGAKVVAHGRYLVFQLAGPARPGLHSRQEAGFGLLIWEMSAEVRNVFTITRRHTSARRAGVGAAAGPAARPGSRPWRARAGTAAAAPRPPSATAACTAGGGDSETA